MSNVSSILIGAEVLVQERVRDTEYKGTMEEPVRYIDKGAPWRGKVLACIGVGDSCYVKLVIMHENGLLLQCGVGDSGYRIAIVKTGETRSSI